MNILLVYPGPRHSTFEVAQGWHEAFEAEGHKVFPFLYHDFWDFYGGAIEFWKAANPKFAEASRNVIMEMQMKMASEQLAVPLLDSDPYLIVVVCGLQLHAKAYRLMDHFDVPRVFILTESPYSDDKQGTLIRHGHADLAFVNDRNSIEGLEKRGGQPVVYLPHSYSPKRHNVAQVGAEYQTDIYFHGTAFPDRNALFDSLELDGHKARIVGVSWKEGLAQTTYVTPNDELANFYRGTKIALNHHRICEEINVETGEARGTIIPGSAYSIGPRAYEIAACGAFQLSDDTRPELAGVFDSSVATYRDAADLQDKVDYYLAHDGERLGMAALAHERVRDCTFENRAAEIFWPACERFL